MLRAQRDWAEPFLEALSRLPNVSAAAKAAGITRRGAYKRRKRDPEFAQAWQDALEQSTDALVGLAYDRAMAGESDTLMIFLLKTHRPEVYGDQSRLELSGPNGQPIPVAIEIEQAIEQVYGDEPAAKRQAAEAGFLKVCP